MPKKYLTGEEGKATRFVAGAKQVEISRRGAERSAEVRRQRKTMREIAVMIGELPAPEKLRKELRKMGISEEDLTLNLVALMAQYQKASKGDTSAIKFLAELKGELENNKIDISLPNIIIKNTNKGREIARSEKDISTSREK